MNPTKNSNNQQNPNSSLPNLNISTPQHQNTQLLQPFLFASTSTSSPIQGGVQILLNTPENNRSSVFQQLVQLQGNSNEFAQQLNNAFQEALHQHSVQKNFEEDDEGSVPVEEDEDDLLPTLGANLSSHNNSPLGFQPSSSNLGFNHPFQSNSVFPQQSNTLNIPAQALQFNDEDVRGTSDLPDFSDEDLEEFRVGLDEGDYSTDALAQIHQQLLERGAPHDKKRRQILGQFVSDQAFTAIHEDEFEDYEEPFLLNSEDESGTDTEGSDSDDEESYESSKRRRQATQKRTQRTNKLLKPHLFKDRLGKLVKAKDKNSVIFKGKRTKTKEGAKTTKETKKRQRTPKQKEKYYRKESKFAQPSIKVGDLSNLPHEPTKRQIQDLAQLNALLALGIPISVAEQFVDSKFVVAQYRGLFYSRSGFNHRTREQHGSINEEGRPIFSSSALEASSHGASGYYYLYNNPDRAEDFKRYQQQVEIEAQKIIKQRLPLRKMPATKEAINAVPRATGNLKAKTMADLDTHFYSEKYHDYQATSQEALSRGADKESKPLDPLFNGLPNSSNPKVSTGDVPHHAAKYAYGMKPYSGHEEDILEPNYDEKGKPQHPYSGKLYASIHPLSDYTEESGPTQLVPLQNEQRINIGKVIIPERESQYEGMVESDRVKYQSKAKFPDFSKAYKSVFEEKYGLTKELFEAFKQAFKSVESNSPEKVFVEALLSNYLVMHSEIRAIEAAIEAANKQGAILVYRTGPRSFGFTPPQIANQSKQTSKSPAKKRIKTDQSDVTVLAKKAGVKGLLKRIADKQQKDEGSSSPSQSNLPVPENIDEQVTVLHGEIIQIAGNGLNCYIRSLVTAASQIYGVLEEGQIENIVSAISDHLANVNLRTRSEMINAGGLVAAEVRRVLSTLIGQNFDPEVHIVMWDGSVGQIVDFSANIGTQPVWLYYTPGHFSVLRKT